MSRWAWLTPDDVPGEVCRAFRIPLPLLPAFMGALDALTHEWRWETFGDMTPAECTAAAAVVIDNVRSYCMIGSVVAYAGASFPDWLLECDGSTHLRVDYPTLYAALDSAFVIDADTFKTPDLRGSFVMGASSGIGDAGGESEHTLTVDEIPAHVHTYLVDGVEMGYLGAEPALVPFENVYDNTGSAGGDQPHNNLPPYVKLRYGIVAL